MAEGCYIRRVGNANPYSADNLTCKAFATCIISASGGLLIGYDLGISGGVITMDPFLKKFFPEVYEEQSSLRPSDNQSCKFDSRTFTLFTSSLYSMQSVPIYLSEVAPYFCRGAMHMLFQSAIANGFLIANVMNHSFVKFEGYREWRLSLGLAIVPAIIVIVAGLVLPETPICLIESGKNYKAKELLIKLHGVTNVDQELAGLVAASNESQFRRFYTKMVSTLQ
ncbi:Sugar transport protein 1 [Euphorbia peplus]|nr:Sugar transport protein 1 [Euphorbia peplus]